MLVDEINNKYVYQINSEQLSILSVKFFMISYVDVNKKKSIELCKSICNKIKISNRSYLLV